MADPVEGTDVDERTCTVEGCENRYLASGYCGKHYQRWRLYGDPHFVKQNKGNQKPRPVVTRRTCLDCGYAGPAADFPRCRNVCKPCQIARQRRWNQANPERRLASRARNAESDKAREKVRRATRKGIEASLLEAYEAKHSGLCDICGLPPTGGKPWLFVDHCHTSGAFRGLLCGSCNTGIGMFRDDPRRLFAAIAYLQRGAVKASLSTGDHQTLHCRRGTLVTVHYSRLNLPKASRRGYRRNLPVNVARIFSGDKPSGWYVRIGPRGYARYTTRPATAVERNLELLRIELARLCRAVEDLKPRPIYIPVDDEATDDEECRAAEDLPDRPDLADPDGDE